MIEVELTWLLCRMETAAPAPTESQLAIDRWERRMMPPKRSRSATDFHSFSQSLQKQTKARIVCGTI